MSKKVIATEKAPGAIGPYSQAMRIGNMIFTSGQIPLNPATGEMVTEIAAATKQSLEQLVTCIHQKANQAISLQKHAS